ncbi:Wzz/FepE/Etk N-terminal domain-containing protein [Halarcobacter anaerophilus]|uniref:Wzz/FepE/Etk N-terminal domain-containing protein n=1 Tax=Halarcobacter anaerophilus TaxID=877500 RepID=UPI0005C88B11|nr:Wzz/FepE/Etk N-terminal domain-containing protein [Halarcobacter anaerophilus]
MGKEELVYEDEIDLKELIITIWRKKVFILFFTVVVTILAVIYVFIKTPIYEVKSVVRVGYIGENLVEDSKILEKKLRLIFNVDSKKNIVEKNKPIVSNISSVNKVDNFIEVSTQGYSNKEALEKNKEVITFLQTEYKAKIDEYILRTNINIKNIEEKIIYTSEVNKVEIEEQIDSLRKVDLTTLENKLKFNKKS